MESIAAIELDLVLLGAAEPGGIVGQKGLPGADLGVVLCELDEGFKGLWFTHQHRSVRQAVGLAGWWYRWSEWPSAKDPSGLAAERKVLWRLVAPA